MARIPAYVEVISVMRMPTKTRFPVGYVHATIKLIITQRRPHSACNVEKLGMGLSTRLHEISNRAQARS